MSVPFRFDTVLRIRETERDVCLQSFAAEQSREVALRAERDLIADERLRALDELSTVSKRKGTGMMLVLTAGCGVGSDH